MEYEDCTEKVEQTAQAMGVNITAADVSISYLLHTRNRPKEEPRPIIATFLRLSVKNEVFSQNITLKTHWIITKFTFTNN